MVVGYGLSCKELAALQSCKNIVSTKLLDTPGGLLVDSTRTPCGLLMDSSNTPGRVHLHVMEYTRTPDGAHLESTRSPDEYQDFWWSLPGSVGECNLQLFTHLPSAGEHGNGKPRQNRHAISTSNKVRRELMNALTHC